MSVAITRPCSQCDEQVNLEDLSDGVCRDCQEPSDDEAECSSCGEVVPLDEVDEDLVCQGCQEESEHRRQLESDYRFWTR